MVVAFRGERGAEIVQPQTLNKHHKIQFIVNLRSTMEPRLQAADLGFFSALAMAGSLSAAAREMRITTAAVSKRLSQMESRLGVPLVNRTTRRMSLTVEGETMLRHARSILAEMADLEQQLGASRSTPRGLLRINATLGFGRSHIGPLISRFLRQYPQVDAQLQLSVDPPSLTDDAFDVCIRFGPPPDTRVIARKIADNQRLMCASPDYIQAHGEPKAPADLVRHNFISIRQGGEAYGVVKLTRGRQGKAETIKTRGNLTTNDGSIAVQWALDGHGILLRAEWDVREHLAKGQLMQVLAQYHTPDADIYAVYPAQHKSAARVRAFVDFLAEAFKPARP
jgi:LysR family transcriptional activator of dmlA